jgi:hypothetical protein
MQILKKQPTVKAPAETFTGDAWFDVIARGEEPSRIRVSVVRFMTHLAMWDAPADGPETEWGVLVTDAEYLGNR